MTQAEPNDALQALAAQIPDRGWRIAARKRSGADGEIEIGKNSDTPNTMTGDEHQSGGSNNSEPPCSYIKDQGTHHVH